MKTRLHEAAKISWVRIGDMARPESRGVLTDGELASEISFHEPGDATTPQLMEVRYVPGAMVAPHSHDSPEIVYVVEGELHWGDRVLGPGSSIFVAGGAVYSYSAGPDGLRIVNFRPVGDTSFHPKRGS